MALGFIGLRGLGFRVYRAWGFRFFEMGSVQHSFTRASSQGFTLSSVLGLPVCVCVCVVSV